MVEASITTTTAASSEEISTCCESTCPTNLQQFDSKRHSRTRQRKAFCLRSPPPSQHLKKILANYPEGPQIFQEALQNADDARAVEFRIILDERTHRCKIPALDRFMVRRFISFLVCPVACNVLIWLKAATRPVASSQVLRYSSLMFP